MTSITFVGGYDFDTYNEEKQYDFDDTQDSSGGQGIFNEDYLVGFNVRKQPLSLLTVLHNHLSLFITLRKPNLCHFYLSMGMLL